LTAAVPLKPACGRNRFHRFDPRLSDQVQDEHAFCQSLPSASSLSIELSPRAEDQLPDKEPGGDAALQGSKTAFRPYFFGPGRQQRLQSKMHG